ncbi:hypothetical protein C8R45DRAFT_282376 [Mycena sanguinolenta]|nr:hypothetical protein C8R45DRAFT_282376 [Mycena sanguinolenta]
MAGTRRKPLPDGFEESADGKQARCRTCNESQLEKNVIFGQITELLVCVQPDDSCQNGQVITTIDDFQLGPERHTEFGLPILTRSRDESGDPKRTLLDASKILFHFSVQHDCRLFKCDASDTRVVRQEHEDTSRTMPTVKHNDEDHFIINLYALHNADMIRQQLPRNLTEPIALYSDRKAHHKEIASTLRTNQVAKRKRTQERRKATRDMNIRLGLTKSAKKGTKRKRNQGQSAEEDPEETTPAGGHDSEVEEEGAEEPTARRRNVTRRARGRGQRNAVDGIDDGEMDDDADSAVGEAAGENESDGGNSDDEGNRGDSDYEPDERDAERPSKRRKI